MHLSFIRALLEICASLSEHCRHHHQPLPTTHTHTQVLYDAPWFRVPYPWQWGAVTFSWAGTLTMLAGALPAMIESLGDYFAGACVCTDVVHWVIKLRCCCYWMWWCGACVRACAHACVRAPKPPFPLSPIKMPLRLLRLLVLHCYCDYLLLPAATIAPTEFLLRLLLPLMPPFSLCSR